MARWGSIVVNLERDESQRSRIETESYGKFPDGKHQRCILSCPWGHRETYRLWSLRLSSCGKTVRAVLQVGVDGA